MPLDSSQETTKATGGRASALPQLSLDSVTILAMGQTSLDIVAYIKRGLIPMDARNPVWVINFGAKVWQHTHAWNTHDLNKMVEVEPQHDFIGFYKTHDRPLITLAPVPGLKTLIYPIKKIIEHFQDDYFFGALPYMLAYALWCGVKGVRLFGADFDYAERTDYESGRCCAEYWMGRMIERNVSFLLPEKTTLRDQRWAESAGRIGYGRVYGYFDNQPQVTRDPTTGRMTVVHNPR